MTRRLLVWTTVEGLVALVVGVVTTYLAVQRGGLTFQSWLDFAILALLVAGAALAVWRPVDAAIGLGGMAWILVLDSLGALSIGPNASPLLTTICGCVLLLAAGLGSRSNSALSRDNEDRSADRH